MKSDELLTDTRSSDGDNAGRSTNILSLAWREKWLFLVFTAAGVGLGYLYFLRLPRSTKSTSQVMIIKRDMGVPGVDQHESAISDDSAAVNMHSLLIKTITAKAVEKYQLASLATFQGLAIQLA